MTSQPNETNRPASNTDLIGRTLGDYQVLRRLGRGAMADVFLSQQVSLNRSVALKVLMPELAADGSYVRRFRHEAMAAAKLVHANIVQIFEVGRYSNDDGTGVHFIAQEYVPGLNLGEAVRRSGTLDAPMVAAILRQVAAALVKADEQGIVHRDIKPENLLLARSGEVKVADFGLARIAGGDGVALTQVGVAMGTPLYMSPEQIEGKSLDTRSDIYSLGATAFHLLAGQPPFDGDTALAVAVQHINTPPPDLEELCPDLPEDLARIVQRMLEKKPADRYSDGRELLADLRALATDGENAWAADVAEWSTAELIALAERPSEGTARLGELMKTAALQPPRKRRPWRLVGATIGVVLCIAAGGLTATLRKPDSLLTDHSGAEVTPRDNPRAELYHAKQIDTEAAWKNVRWLQPDADKYYYWLADVGLVRYYFFERPTNENLQKSLDVCRRLANDSDVDPQFRPVGLAGMAIAYALLGQRIEATAAFDRLKSTQNLEDALERYPDLREKLRVVTRRNAGK